MNIENTKNLIKTLYDKDYVFIATIISVILIAYGILSGCNMSYISLYIGSVLSFSAFDSYGHRYLYMRENSIETNELYNASYRVIQTTFQIILFLLLTTYSWIVALLFMFTWWLGTCDWLYYILMKLNWKDENMFWLWWTPYGIINNKLDKKISYKYMVTYSIISVVLSMFILLLLEIIKLDIF